MRTFTELTAQEQDEAVSRCLTYLQENVCPNADFASDDDLQAVAHRKAETSLYAEEWTLYNRTSLDVNHPDYFGRPKMYRTRAQAERGAEGLVRKYPFYETRVSEVAHSGEHTIFRVWYRKASDSPAAVDTTSETKKEG
jgi:hypothetical protein